VTDPLNRTTYTSYDHLGGGGCGSCNDSDKPASITYPSGRIVSFTYDSEWRLLSQTDGVNTPDAATTSYTYDSEGNMLTTTDPMGRVWTFQYDNRNRRTKAIDPLNHVTEWTYDAAGNALTVKRPDNGITTNVYDSRNRLVSSTDPKNQTTTFEYGGTGLGTQGDNLVRLTDARGNSYTFEYDQEDRQTTMIYPDTSFESWSYDDAGNMVQYRARNGVTMNCTLDNRNRDTFCDWSDATTDTAKTYDAVGRVTGLDNGVSNLTYTYDVAGQLVTETQNPSAVAGGVDPGSWTVAYTYDADGARQSVTYPSGPVVNYTYTGRKQLATISADGPPPLATFTYNPNGSRIGKVLENNTAVVYSYDNANRLTSVDHRTGNASFLRLDYTLNSVGNRLSKNATGSGVPGGSWLEAYSHDAVDQLTGANYTTTGGNRSVGYQYDPVGNREVLTDTALPAAILYTANNLNQYTQVDSLPVPTYDANGNLLTFNPDGTGPSAQAFTYDSNDKLLTAMRNGTTVTTHYDARRRAVARTVAPSAGSPVTTFLVWDEWSLIEERTVTGNLVQTYVHGPVIDETLSKTDTSGTVYYHHDGLGSTAALSNATGTPVEFYTYDAYGAAQVWGSSFNPHPSSLLGNRFMFTGREWFAEAGTFDYRNRAYSAELGRFLQVDPLRFEGTKFNIYSYVANAPTMFVDPFGEKDAWPGPYPGKPVNGLPFIPGKKIGAPGAGILGHAAVCLQNRLACEANCLSDPCIAFEQRDRCLNRCEKLEKICLDKGYKHFK
jgi:RHS repeat-associated protein